MNWMYREPSRSDFITEEEYLEDLELYEAAIDNYCEEYLERRREEREFN